MTCIIWGLNSNVYASDITVTNKSDFKKQIKISLQNRDTSFNVKYEDADKDLFNPCNGAEYGTMKNALNYTF